MTSSAVRLVIDDPEAFHLLTTDMKEQIIQGAIATVNMQAALTRKNAVRIVQSDFVLRNNFTIRQIQYQPMEKSRFISLANITARAGITEKADYMARQEAGGSRRSRGGNNLAIPTARARGGNKGSPVLKKYYLQRLRRVGGGGHTTQGHTFRSWLVAKAAVAFKNNLFMRHNDRLFAVTSFGRTGGRVSFKMEQIYNFAHEETVTPASPWLWPASEQPAKDVESIFISQMRKRGM